MVDMVTDVRIGIVDGLKRYLVYGLGWWMDWKGAQSTVGFAESLARISEGPVLEITNPRQHVPPCV
jgi:hypothetical protein